MDCYIKHDSEFNFAICTACWLGIPSGHVPIHMYRFHKSTWVKHRKALKEHVERMRLTIPEDLEQPEGVLEAVEGIEVKDGWSCDWENCTFCSISKKHVENHCRSEHGKEAFQSKPWFQCRVQTLLGNPYIR
jgi:hypothetical protein